MPGGSPDLRGIGKRCLSWAPAPASLSEVRGSAGIGWNPARGKVSNPDMRLYRCAVALAWAGMSGGWVAAQSEVPLRLGIACTPGPDMDFRVTVGSISKVWSCTWTRAELANPSGRCSTAQSAATLCS